MTQLARLAAVLLAGSVLAGCSGGGGSAVDPATWQPSLAAGNWSEPYKTRNVPEAAPGGGVLWRVPAFGGPFPCVPGCPALGYMVTGAPAPLTGASITFTLEVETIGGPVWQYWLEAGNPEGAGAPASVHLLLQRAGDDLTQEFFRWWSTAAIVLRDGLQTLTVPLDPALWSSVYGKRGDLSGDTLEGFRSCLDNIGRVGATCGGGSFYGHGVNVSGGTATITIRDYRINR